MKTTLGKAAALKALKERRAKNAKRPKIDNASLPACSPMFFSCLTCNAEIVVPETYISKPDLCGECQALQTLGWLE